MEQKVVETRLPLDLQLFADSEQQSEQENAQATGTDTGAKAPTEGGAESQTTEQSSEPQYTVEGLLAKIAEQNAAMIKMKSDYDKLMKSEGDMRKKLNAKLTVDEKAAEAKAEAEAAREEHLKELERKLAVIESTSRYQEMGMAKELAAETAIAEVDGNRELVNLNIQKYQTEWKKAKEAEIRQQYLDQMPVPQSGNDGEVDYGKQINDALNNGNSSDAVMAILKQAQASGGLNIQ